MGPVLYPPDWGPVLAPAPRTVSGSHAGAPLTVDRQLGKEPITCPWLCAGVGHPGRVLPRSQRGTCIQVTITSIQQEKAKPMPVEI